MDTHAANHAATDAAAAAFQASQVSEASQAVIAEAFRLADTGDYHDYTDIEFALCFSQASPHARAVLGNPSVRMAVNRRCADAREHIARVTG